MRDATRDTQEALRDLLNALQGWHEGWSTFSHDVNMCAENLREALRPASVVTLWIGPFRVDVKEIKR